jgi:hypothetical protein
VNFQAKVKMIKFTLDNGDSREIPGLFPINDQQREKLKNLKQNEIVNVDFKRLREKNILDQAWAVVTFLYENWRDGGNFKTADNFRDMISLELGFSHPVIWGGNVVHIPDTWGYKTSEDDFLKRLYNPLMDYAMDYLDFQTRKELIQASIDNAMNNK